ncbi:MAG: adaptin protein, partial [Gammaproteobacteria bacterium]|nr:adaptin protein [Gammaproteobacteria bacterium]NIX85327.1 adaptin protein [Gammaproteobacteria bacterium]
MIVFAFDRDLTVDSSPHPGPIPLKWVRFLARKTACEVWAVGNQAL